MRAGQIWSNQHQTLQKSFSKLTSPVKKIGSKPASKGELMHPTAGAAGQKCASHRNLDEWTIHIAMLNCFLIVNA